MANRFQLYFITMWVLAFLVGSGCAALLEKEIPVPPITKEKLKGWLGRPEVILLDVRKKPDWETSSRKIPGAIHEDYEQVKIWAPKYPRGKTFVLYCA